MRQVETLAMVRMVRMEAKVVRLHVLMEIILKLWEVPVWVMVRQERGIVARAEMVARVVAVPARVLALKVVLVVKGVILVRHA